MDGNREPLVLRAWGCEHNEATALQDVLARVHFERGHFRDISEATLQEEIAAEGAMELSDSDEDQDDAEEEQETKSGQANSREELFKAKVTMLSFVGQAEQDLLRSLDYVSLLESKHNPNGAITMSPVLKSSVPVGTLGTDVWHRQPEDKTRKAQDDLLAASVRLESLQKSADALLSAATRLEDNARKEVRYWDEILAISDKGWSVSRIRQHPHLLGVHFGFSGSSPAFSRRSLAALVSGSDGDITLERGIGTKPMSLRAVVRKNGRVIGRSVPFSGNHKGTTLDARIRHARDSLYDEELHHEMLRQSRDLANAGASIEGSTISFDSSSSVTGNRHSVSLELISFDQDLPFESDTTQESDALAHAVLYAARLLLGQAHRDRLKRRASPPMPMSETVVEQPAFPIIKPLIWILRHLSTRDHVDRHLNLVAAILSSANVDVSLQSLSTGLAGLRDTGNLESLVTLLLQPLRSAASVAITYPGAARPFELNIHIDTALDMPKPTMAKLFMSHDIQDGDRGLHFESSQLPIFLTACDTVISEMLVRVLHGSLGDEWSLNLRDLCVTRLVARPDQVDSAHIELDLEAKRLHLHTKERSYSWSNVPNEGLQSFLEIAHKLAGNKV